MHRNVKIEGIFLKIQNYSVSPEYQGWGEGGECEKEARVGRFSEKPHWNQTVENSEGYASLPSRNKEEPLTSFVSFY